VTGGIDGADFIKNGKLRKFSEHQLLDCSEPGEGYYDYYEQHFAILTKEYIPRMGLCRYDASEKTSVKVSQVNLVTPLSTKALLTAVSVNPVTAAIEADKDVF